MEAVTQRKIALQARCAKLVEAVNQMDNNLSAQLDCYKKLETLAAAPLLRPEDRRRARIRKAAWALESASHGEALSARPADVAAAREEHLGLLSAEQWSHRAIIGLVFLTFIEVPPWCHEYGTKHDHWAWRSSSEWCAPASHEHTMLLSGIWYLPPGIGFICELVFEALILRKLYIERRLAEKHFSPAGAGHAAGGINNKLACVFAVGSLLDTAVFMNFRAPIRLTFIFRSGLIFLLPIIQHIFFNIFKKTVMWEFSSVAVFLLGTIVFFAWISVTLFQESSEISYMEGKEEVLANKGLDSFSGAIYTMFVAGVSGDFIGCFLPSFVKYRASGLLWLVYLVATKVLLLNLVLDTLISAYLKGEEREREAATGQFAKGVLESYRELSEDGRYEITEEDLLDYAAELGRSPRRSATPPQVVSLLHARLGSVTRENFCDACTLLWGRRLWVTRRDRGLCPAWLARLVWEPEEAPAIDEAVNRVLLVNFALILLESAYDLHGWPQPAWFDNIEVTFSLVYVLEVLAKLSVKSFGEYWSNPANQFDFWTTWLLLATSVVQYLPVEAVDLSRYMNILRLLRLVRIVLRQLKQFPSVQFMVRTLVRIVTAAGEILSLLGLTIFFFSALSVNLFGGVLYEGNPDLEETEYAEKYWYALNFNDMIMAFAAYFLQILSEYIPPYAEAIDRAVPWGGIAWLVFPLFYALCVAISYELFTAFTIEVFLEMKKETYKDEEEEEGEEGEKGGGSANGEGASSHGESEGEECVPFASFVHRLHEGFQKKGMEIHCDVMVEQSFQEELEEAYKKYLAHEVEGAFMHGSEQTCAAAWEVENAIYNQLLEGYPGNIHAARNQHLRALAMGGWYHKAIVCLVLLTLVEVPAWCHQVNGVGDLWAWMPGTEWCPSASKGNDFYLSGIWYLPPGYAFLLELGIEFVVLRKFLLEYVHERDHFHPHSLEYHSRRNILLGCFFAVGSILDTAVFAFFQAPIRLTFVFRTGLLCLLPGPQRLAALIFNRRMMGEFASVAVFFVGTVVFFAWIVVTIFKDMDGASYVLPGEGRPVPVNEGFESLRTTIYNLFLAGTTEGYIDVFMPSFVQYRSSGLLWVLFLLLTQVFLLNMVIDSFVAAYIRVSEGSLEHTLKIQAHAFAKAFHELSDDGSRISEHVFLAFMRELGRSPRMFCHDQRVAVAIYREMGEITKEKFCYVCGLVQNKIWVARKNSLLEKYAPKLWDSHEIMWLRRKVWEPQLHPDIDIFMNWVLFANFITIVLKSMAELNHWPVPSIFGAGDLAFTFLYIFEVLAKLSVKSFAEYWSFGTNRFDFFTTWFLAGTTVLKHLPIEFVQSDLRRYANILRLFRLLRVFKQLKQYPQVQFMAATISKMVMASGDILIIQGICLFFFTTFSVNFFGGVLYEGNPRLEGTDYAENHWFIFNFNDALMAFNSWFVMLFTEYAPEWAEALWLTSDYGPIAWWVFPAYYLIGVVVLFYILKAFTVELYLALKEEHDKLEHGGEEEEEHHTRGVGKIELREEELVSDIEKTLRRDHNESLHCSKKTTEDFQKQVKAAYFAEIQHGGAHAP